MPTDRKKNNHGFSIQRKWHLGREARVKGTPDLSQQNRIIQNIDPFAYSREKEGARIPGGFMATGGRD